MLKRYQFVLFVILLIIAWICLNVSVSLLSSSVATDISDDKKYSLTKQTYNWLQNNNHNIYVRFYKGNLDKNPQLKKYANDIMLLLEQYQDASDGKISIKTVEVAPFAATEIAAKKAGLIGGDGKPWLGMAISDEKGNFASIPFFNPERKPYLEHDISRVFAKLINNTRPTIGVMSSEISVMSSLSSLDYTVDWSFIKQLKKDYNVKKISNKTSRINDDIDVLMIVNPKLLREMTVYAIDQYLVRGGRIIVFVDPLFEATHSVNNNKFLKGPSGLEVWLFKMGVFYPFDMVLGSKDGFVQLKTKDDKTIVYPFWIETKNNNFEHLLLNGLKKLRFNHAAPLRLIERENIKQQILVSASKMSGEQKVDDIIKDSIAESIGSFKGDDEKRVLAVLLEGKFNSLFTKPYLDTEYYLMGDYAYKFLSENDGKVVVIADSDFLDAKLWETEDKSNNFDFLERIVDYLSDNKLTSVEPKINSTKNVAINNKLYELAQFYYSNQKDVLEKELINIIAEQNDMFRKIEHQELITSIVVANKIESLEKNKYQLRQQLEQIEYKTKNLYRAYFVAMIIINILIAIAILFLATIIMRRRSLPMQKLVRRIVGNA